MGALLLELKAFYSVVGRIEVKFLTENTGQLED
jgi:hypothetical protein